MIELEYPPTHNKSVSGSRHCVSTSADITNRREPDIVYPLAKEHTITYSLAKKD